MYEGKSLQFPESAFSLSFKSPELLVNSHSLSRAEQSSASLARVLWMWGFHSISRDSLGSECISFLVCL